MIFWGIAAPRCRTVQRHLRDRAVDADGMGFAFREFRSLDPGTL
jgi:hypothetical protein